MNQAALLITSDLMLASAAHGAADRHGIRLVTCRIDAAKASEESLGLIAVDLRLPGLNISELVSRLRRQAPAGVKIVAFGPHVHEQSLAAAAEAGCDEVFTRGQFERRFDLLLDQLSSTSR
jgi:DNA-binding response OmpR family regulator